MGDPFFRTTISTTDPFPEVRPDALALIRTKDPVGVKETVEPDGHSKTDDSEMAVIKLIDDTDTDEPAAAVVWHDPSLKQSPLGPTSALLSVSS